MNIINSEINCKTSVRVNMAPELQTFYIKITVSY
jgi:hypothetical protein